MNNLIVICEHMRRHIYIGVVDGFDGIYFAFRCYSEAAVSDVDQKTGFGYDDEMDSHDTKYIADRSRVCCHF